MTTRFRIYVDLQPAASGPDMPARLIVNNRDKKTASVSYEVSANGKWGARARWKSGTERLESALKLAILTINERITCVSEILGLPEAVLTQIKLDEETRVAIIAPTERTSSGDVLDGLSDEYRLCWEVEVEKATGEGKTLVWEKTSGTEDLKLALITLVNGYFRLCALAAIDPTVHVGIVRSQVESRLKFIS